MLSIRICGRSLVTCKMETYSVSKIEEAYDLFENKREGVIKVAVECWH